MKGSEPSLWLRGLVKEAPNVTPSTAAREVRVVNMLRMVVARCNLGCVIAVLTLEREVIYVVAITTSSWTCMTALQHPRDSNTKPTR